MTEPTLPSPVPSLVALAADSDLFLHPPHQTVSAVPPTVTVEPADEPTDEPTVVPTKYFRAKPLVEWAITASLMVVAIPIMAIVAFIVLVCDGRPLFYRQVRVGKNGKNFRIWKFRTMRTGAEKNTGPVWSSPNDSRVTRSGRWLRCCHLDELPQLINVLAGEMSLVGPRPERPEFVTTLAEEVPGYLRRTRVRPGITGLAQLKLGYDESIVGIPQKVACDLQYIRTASLFQDLKLLAATLPYIAGQLWFKLRAKSRDRVPTAAAPMIGPVPLKPVPLKSENPDSAPPQESAIELTQNVA
ncbi:sugar transferase [Stieleria sp. ICT_E10.1]|uniref:sugar transferase n=1 Tax=Stieleria sedimenti TaxID=2976331 RepID=UPI00217F4B8D|nr:sugar transferase [Stieleria sedimenti]MCS7466987.1 sugar transferase [Stieleria sedimenti]